jgi:predicted nucleic acid-binding protein
MTLAVLDTNVVVQSLISSPRTASAQVLDAFYDGRFEIAYSPVCPTETFEEAMHQACASSPGEIVPGAGVDFHPLTLA